MEKRLEIHVLTNKYGFHLAMKLPMSLNELLSIMPKIKNTLTSMFAEGLLDYTFATRVTPSYPWSLVTHIKSSTGGEDDHAHGDAEILLSL